MNQGDATDRLIAVLWQLADQARHLVATQPMLRAALLAMALIMLGGWLRRPLPTLSSLLRFCGNLGLMGVLVLTVIQVAHIDTGGLTQRFGLDMASPDTATVQGRETRIPLGPDGHFWVRAEVNGVPRRFLIDTGATLTTLSTHSAAAAHVRRRADGEQIVLNTANGSTTGDLARIVARRLDTVVAEGIGDTNVLGMNFLTQLAGWRVEGRTMVLEPHHPAAKVNPEG